MTDQTRFRAALSDSERRSHFRVMARVEMRVRMAPLAANDIPDTEHDLVTAFEELSSGATRFRKELGAPGRAFLDRLMAVMDGVVGQLAHQHLEQAWTSEGVIEANISAGGIGFLSKHHLHLDDGVEVQFSVLSATSSIPFRAQAAVRRCQASPEGGFEIGLEFLEMSSSSRERLVRLVFDLQRLQLRQRSES